MGEFVFRGPVARDLLQYLTANDLAAVAVGSCHYSFFLNTLGGTVDDAMVYRRSDVDYLVVVNAGNIEKDWAHVVSVAEGFPGADIRNESDDHALLAVQGPGAFAALESLLSLDPVDLPFHAVRSARLGDSDVLVAASGYTGENGVEIFVEPERTSDVWKVLTSEGKAVPCGLGARNTLRLEASLALYGHELDDETSPLEANLGFAVAKSGDYLGSRVIEEQRKSGTRKSLVMIEMEDRAIPRQGYSICANDREIGIVTSGSLAPWLGKNIGMGYVEPAFRKPGTDITIGIRDRAARARVVKRPFYTRPNRV